MYHHVLLILVQVLEFALVGLRALHDTTNIARKKRLRSIILASGRANERNLPAFYVAAARRVNVGVRQAASMSHEIHAESLANQELAETCGIEFDGWGAGVGE